MPADDHIATVPDRPPKLAANRKKTRGGAKARPAPAQLSLFDTEIDEGENADHIEIMAAPPPLIIEPAAKPAHKRARRVTDERASRVLGVCDMPVYSDEAHESVAAALKLLPQAQLWFTYKDIQFFFGVSRATVARRLRDGLVPGIRMAGASVIEDAPVRRFDRGQLRWLLLALRHRQRQLTR